MRRLGWLFISMFAWWVTQLAVMGSADGLALAFVLYFGSMYGVPVVAYVAFVEWITSPSSPGNRWIAFLGAVGLGLVVFAGFVATNHVWRWSSATDNWRFVLVLLLPTAVVVGLYVAKMLVERTKRA